MTRSPTALRDYPAVRVFGFVGDDVLREFRRRVEKAGVLAVLRAHSSFRSKPKRRRTKAHAARHRRLRYGF